MRKFSTRFLPFLISLGATVCLHAQISEYNDYIGAGHSDGIVVSTSNNYERPFRENHADGYSTIDGNGLDADRMEAARFLSQAAFGGSVNEIERLAQDLNFNEWIENQSRLPATSMLTEVESAFSQAQSFNSQNQNYNNTDRHFQFAWWQSIMTNSDVLRQRVAMALSEILVISTRSSLPRNGKVYASYYDIFLRNAFGNYRDILQEVSLHPAMGVYLTHFRNPKADTTNNVFPDENYAREVMQLFTIGLFELNNDGSLKLDNQGQSIPTYDLEDTRQLARVFTGLGAGALNESAAQNGFPLNFNTRTNRLNFLVPMKMYEEQHEEGEKIILGDYIIPDGLTGMEDINLALDYLFNHPNVGPFISRKLIQHFIKSNPSEVYIDDVASIFNDNGEGIRGDLKAVIKEILLHEEARDCLWQNDPAHGKLKAPIVRYSALARMAETYGADYYYTDGNGYSNDTEHRVLSSPSVFNFYLPDHKPNGALAEMDLYGPEFQIYNSVTSIGYVNQVDRWVRNGRIFAAYDTPDDVRFDKLYYTELARDPEVLINFLDAYLISGRMHDNTRNLIKTSLEELPTWNEENMLRQRVEIAFYIALISPEFNILK